MARIKHIALVTDDPVKTAEFYKEHLHFCEARPLLSSKFSDQNLAFFTVSVSNKCVQKGKEKLYILSKKTVFLPHSKKVI